MVGARGRRSGRFHDQVEAREGRDLTPQLNPLPIPDPYELIPE